MRILLTTNLTAYSQMTTAGMEGSRLAILLSRINSGGLAALVPQGLQPMYGMGTGTGGGGGGTGTGGGGGGGMGGGSGGGSGGGGGTVGGQNRLPGPTTPGDGYDSGPGGSGSGGGANDMSGYSVNGRRGFNPKNREGYPDNCFNGGNKR